MMKAQTRVKENLHKAKGLKISLGIHLAIMVVALIPMISSTISTSDEEMYIIPIEFAELSSTANEGMQARSIVRAPVPKPVVDKQEEKPAPVEAPEVVEETQIVEEVEEVESKIVEETVEEVVASEDQIEAEDEISASEGGSNETNVPGDQEGTETEGEESGTAGLDGDGILTRRIIYRQDITQVAEKDGVIAINVCIDRQGKVSAAKFNEEHTTIDDTELIRRALYIAAEYRFELDFSAPKRECGMLTFIFDVEGNG
jgi:hypothetical protein